MRTILTKYNINIETTEGRDEWQALKVKLSHTQGRGHRMKCISDNYAQRQAMPDGEITLETGHLFSNQWNTEGEGDHNGFRVFDWYQGIVPNTNIKTGHYLKITAEMISARQSRYGCGYCGHQIDKPDIEFCDQCRGSQYLKESELKLLRLRPVCDEAPRNSRPPLTPEEEAALLPSFKIAKKAQRLAAFEERKKTARKQAAKKVEDAKVEEAVTLWCIDHDIEPDLFIYYSHTKRVCFGWRDRLSSEAKIDLLTKLGSEFPFDYDIKQTEEARLS